MSRRRNEWRPRGPSAPKGPHSQRWGMAVTPENVENLRRLGLTDVELGTMIVMTNDPTERMLKPWKRRP